MIDLDQENKPIKVEFPKNDIVVVLNSEEKGCIGIVQNAVPQ